MARLFLTPIDLNRNELRNAVIQNLTVAPASPLEGQVYWKSDSNELYIYDGTAFQRVYPVLDSTSTVTGGIRLTNDLGGTATAPTVVQTHLQDGTQTTPSVLFASDTGTNTGFYRFGEDTIGVTAGGTVRNLFGISGLYWAGTTVNDVLSKKNGNFTLEFRKGDDSAFAIVRGADPLGATDLATKNYVDANSGSNDWKASCRVATTGAETFTVVGGAVSQITGTTVDGVSPNVNDRILIKDAPATTGVGSPNSNQPANGIYTVTSNTTNLSVSRASDATNGTNLTSECRVGVEEGTVNSFGLWEITTTGALTVNTTAIQWANKHWVELGSNSAPSYSFIGDTNTGMYSSGADNVNFTTGGTSRLGISTTQITGTVQFVGPDGSAATPSFRATTDATGIYRAGANQLGFSGGGTSVGTWNATTLLASVTGGVQVDSGSGTNTATLTLTGRNTGTANSATIVASAAGALTYNVPTGTTHALQVNASTVESISSTGVTVTGTISSTGTQTVDAGAGTASAVQQLVGRSTGTAATVSLTASSVGTLTTNVPTGQTQILQVNASTVASVASTGVAVTGTLSATSTISQDAGAGTATAVLNLVGRNAGTANTASITASATGGLTYSTAGTTSQIFQVGATTKMTISNTTVDFVAQRLTNIADPTSAQDAATKNYVDNAAQGLDAKASVRVATTAAESFTIATGAVTTITGLTGGAAPVIDGVTVATNDRILIKDSPATTGAGSANSNQPPNGLYTITALGTGQVSVARATDMDVWTEVPSAYVWVEEGTINLDSGWVVTSNAGGTINTNNIAWVLFSSAGTLIAGNGLTKTGNSIDAVGTANRISVAADSIDISASYVGQTSITTLGTIGTGTWQGTLVGTTWGGTGISNPTTNAMLVGAGASALTQISPTATAGTTQIVATGVNTAVPAFKSFEFSTSVGDGVSTSITVTHNLGTKDVIVQVYDNSSPFAQVECDAQHTSTSAITLVFSVAPTTNQYRAVVMGLA